MMVQDVEGCRRNQAKALCRGDKGKLWISQFPQSSRLTFKGGAGSADPDFDVRVLDLLDHTVVDDWQALCHARHQPDVAACMGHTG